MCVRIIGFIKAAFWNKVESTAFHRITFSPPEYLLPFKVHRSTASLVIFYSYFYANNSTCPRSASTAVKKLRAALNTTQTNDGCSAKYNNVHDNNGAKSRHRVK